jgi:hypothetical protein
MAPPVSVIRSWRGAPAVKAAASGRGDGLVDHDGALRQQVAHRLADLLRGEPAARPAGAPGGLQRAGPGRPAARARQRGQAGGGVLVGADRVCTWQPGVPGRWPCRGRRRRTPATWRPPGPGAAGRSAARPPARPGRRCAPPAGRPAPRSSRVGKTSASSLTPLCAATFAAASSAGLPQRARPPSSSALGSPLRRAWAMRCTVASSAGLAAGAGVAAARSPPSPQDTSAGRISVATWPGRPRAAARASTASRQSSAVRCEVRTKPGETLRATVSMSDCSCAS